MSWSLNILYKNKKADLSFTVTIPSSSHVLLSSVHFRDSKKKKGKRNVTGILFSNGSFSWSTSMANLNLKSVYMSVDGHSVYKQVAESVMTARQQSCWLFLCNPVLSILLSLSIFNMMCLFLMFFFLSCRWILPSLHRKIPASWQRLSNTCLAGSTVTFSAPLSLSLSCNSLDHLTIPFNILMSVASYKCTSLLTCSILWSSGLVCNFATNFSFFSCCQF